MNFETKILRIGAKDNEKLCQKMGKLLQKPILVSFRLTTMHLVNKLQKKQLSIRSLLF